MDAVVELSVSRRGEPLFALTTYTLKRPSHEESNAIHFPSGDQLGVPVMKGRLMLVICTQCAPSLSQPQISSFDLKRLLLEANSQPLLAQLSSGEIDFEQAETN